MKFRTEFTPDRRAPLDPCRPVALVGSCFTDNIGACMRRGMWDARVNPCGTLFNPASIARSLEMALAGEEPEMVEGFCWDFPTRFRSAGQCAEALAGLRRAVIESQALVVTFGTAWVYELASEPGRIVANCHKQPASVFSRRLLSPEEIAERWQRLAAGLRGLNPGLRLIFTVSPVRHLKDGFAGNSLSKATLRVTVERLLAEVPGAEYFPAFEIVTDDLRDYRFYADDLLHPSAQGVEYVWEKFCETYLDEPSRQLLRQASRLRARLDHRPIVAPEKSSGPAAESAEAFPELVLFLSGHPGLRL